MQQRLYEETSEVLQVPGATNVKYILRGTHLLTLLVNLEAALKGSSLARCREARVEDLPLLLTLNVGLLGGGVVESRAAAAAVRVPVRYGDNTWLVVDGALLRIDIDLSAGPSLSSRAAPGQSEVLASIQANSKIGASNFLVTLKLLCEGGGRWSSMPSPRSVGAVEEISPNGIVARALQFSPSVSLPRVTDSPAAFAGLVELNEFLTLDKSRLPMAKLRLNMEGKRGQMVNFTGDILSGIGISLRVICSGNQTSPLDARNNNNSSRKVLNVKSYEEKTHSGEDILVVEFDTSNEEGLVQKGTRMISNASHLIVSNRYEVNFMATGPVENIPDFHSVYNSVCSFLNSKPNPLASLVMQDVREFVAKDLNQRIMKREFKNLVWQAVRLYVIEDYLPELKREASASPRIPQIS